jgi:cytoskeletal protein CcmA (bactofilin family)
MTTIGPSLKITGEIASQEDVTIHGKVTGKITMQGGALLVSPTAVVEAEAQGTRITIHGSYAGDVSAAERVELSNTANVTGTLIAPAIVIQDGAVFNGMIEIGSRGKNKAAA